MQIMVFRGRKHQSRAIKYYRGENTKNKDPIKLSAGKRVGGCTSLRKLGSFQSRLCPKFRV